MPTFHHLRPERLIPPRGLAALGAGLVAAEAVVIGLAGGSSMPAAVAIPAGAGLALGGYLVGRYRPDPPNVPAILARLDQARAAWDSPRASDRAAL